MSNSKELVEQLLDDVNRGLIGKDHLLRVCLETLDKLDSNVLFEMAIDNGFIEDANDDDEEFVDYELDAPQKIIEKVLRRHGE